MKKLILLMMMIILNSCNNEQSTNFKKNENINYITTECNPDDSMGIYHNQFFNFHFNRMIPHNCNHISRCVLFHEGKYYFKKSEYDSLIQSYLLFGLSKGVNSDSLSLAINSCYELFEDADMFQTINNIEVIVDIRSKFIDLLTSSYSLGFINQSEFNFIYPIAFAIDNENYNYVDSIFTNLNLCSYTYDSIPHIFGAKSIYLNSKDYWTAFLNIDASKIRDVKNKSSKNISSISSTTQQIVWAADAVGLALGTRFGGGLPAGFFAAIASGIAITIITIEEESRRCPLCGVIHDC